MTKQIHHVRDLGLFFLLVVLIQFLCVYRLTDRTKPTAVFFSIVQYDIYKTFTQASYISTSIFHRLYNAKKETPIDLSPFLTQIDLLTAQLNQSENLIRKYEDSITFDDSLLQEIQALRTRLLHTKKQIMKTNNGSSFILGPIGASAQVIKERNIRKKILAIAQNTTQVISAIDYALTGEEKKKTVATQTDQAISLHKIILKSLQSPSFTSKM